MNLGDSYAREGGDSRYSGRHWDGRDNNPITGHNRYAKDVGLKPKSLCNIPSRFAIAMTDRGWTLRNEIIWYKPNCMPSSASDRFTVDFEKIFFFSKNKQYYFEQQFEGMSESTKDRDKYGFNGAFEGQFKGTPKEKRWQTGRPIKNPSFYNEQGRNKRCVWEITTKPFSGSHFAVFPPDLIETPIKAGCPRYVCKKCGTPREKIIESKTSYDESLYDRQGEGVITGRKTNPHGGLSSNWKPAKSNIKGYTDCGCGEGFEGGIVLDPFMGAGTTAIVAEQLGMNWVGIEINEEYKDLAMERIKHGDEYIRKKVKSERMVKDIKYKCVNIDNFME